METYDSSSILIFDISHISKVSEVAFYKKKDTPMVACTRLSVDIKHIIMQKLWK